MKLALLTLVFMLLASTAFGHDQVAGKSEKFDACCGSRDCDMILDVSEVEGGYKIRIGAITEVVPYQQALPSPDTSFWRCHLQSDPTTRTCFFVPIPLLY